MPADQHAPVSIRTGQSQVQSLTRMAGVVTVEGGGDREGWPGQLCACSQTTRPPAPARATPAQRDRPAEGWAGLGREGFPAPWAASGSPGTESRAPSADPAAAIGRGRALPPHPPRPPAPGPPPPTRRRGDDAGRGERTRRSARVVALPPSPRPGAGGR